MSTKIQVRRGVAGPGAGSWQTVNPVLDVGEIGFETDTGHFKIGDGTTPYNTLKYVYESFSFGPSFTDQLTFATSSATLAPIKLPSGVDKTSPVSGDIWNASDVIKYRTSAGVSQSLAFNPTTTYGDVIYATASGTPGTLGRLAPPSGSGAFVVAQSVSGGTSVAGLFYTPYTTAATSSTLAFRDGSGNLTANAYNSLSLTANTTGFSVTGGSTTSKTLTVNNTLALSGTDSTTMTFPATSGTVVTKDSTDQLTNKSFASNTYSTTQTLTTANDIVFISATAAWTLTLPTPTAGKVLHIVRTDATGFIITVAGHINNVASTTNTAWFAAASARKAILVSNGTTWYATSNGAF
jgi:hypothetical protein